MTSSSQNGSTPLQGTGPVGSGEFVVQEGDCIASIAGDHGFFWETLWNHPKNGELQRVRKDPNVLLPGDRVHVPILQAKVVSGMTERRHHFVRKGATTRLRLRFLDEGEPLNGQRYVVNVEGRLFDGRLDNDGALDVPILSSAKSAVVSIGTSSPTEYNVAIGNLDPIDEITGIQGRLHNLGFSPGPVDGIFGPRTRGALSRFQQANKLAATGDLDENTRLRLLEYHEA